MNCLTKLIAFLLVLVGIVVGLGFLGQFLFNKYVPEMVNEWAAEKTDFDFDLDFLKLDILDSSFSIKDFDISNPEQWADSDFFTLNEATCDFSLKNSSRDLLYFDRLALDIKEISLIIDENGNANWAELKNQLFPKSEDKEVAEEKTVEEDSASEADEESQELPSFFVEELVLGLDKIEIVDYSRTPTWKRSYDLNMRIELKDVDKMEDLITPLINQLIASGATSAIPLIYEALGEKNTSEDISPMKLLNGLLGN